MHDSKSRVIAAIGLLADVTGGADFREPWRAVENPLVRREVLASYTKKAPRNYWVLLESLVVFDEILYDGYAFKRHGMSNDARERTAVLQKHGLVRAQWPIEVYEHTSKAVAEWTAFTKESPGDGNDNQATEPLPSSTIDEASFDSAEKNYHDDLYESEISRFSFAESYQAFERTLFYAELGRYLGINLLPRPSSDGTIVERIGRSYEKSAHCLMQQTLEKYDAQIRPAEMRMYFPPLAQKIASMSIEQGKAPIEIVAELRNSKNAAAYRSHIADLQHELNADKISLPAIERLQLEFKNVVDRWVTDGATKEGISYKTREIRVQVIPTAAAALMWLHTGNYKDAASVAGLSNVTAQAIFGSTITVRDPILWGAEKYISFVADWYN